jgi:hypothetical protein
VAAVRWERRRYGSDTFFDLWVWMDEDGWITHAQLYWKVGGFAPGVNSWNAGEGNEVAE